MQSVARAKKQKSTREIAKPPERPNDPNVAIQRTFAGPWVQQLTPVKHLPYVGYRMKFGPFAKRHVRTRRITEKNCSEGLANWVGDDRPQNSSPRSIDHRAKFGRSGLKGFTVRRFRIDTRSVAWQLVPF